jgi:hypothetical protein
MDPKWEIFEPNAAVDASGRQRLVSSKAFNMPAVAMTNSPRSVRKSPIPSQRVPHNEAARMRTRSAPSDFFATAKVSAHVTVQHDAAPNHAY